MTLFPKSRVHDYLLLFPLPDDINYLNIPEHLSTIDGLLNYSQNLIRFLEINKVYGDIYLPGSALYEALFSRFAHYYGQETHLRSPKDIKFELIRLEQTIHLLNSSIGTQNISGYLGLVDENCDNSKIVELIFLLYKKFDYWYDGYSELYASFAHFLVPYLQLVAEIKFEFVKLLNMEDEVIQGLVKKYIGALKEALTKRKVNIHIEEERLLEWAYIGEKLEEIKGLILGMKKDEKYYQELGLYSFLVHLRKLALEKNQTFVEICVVASMYLESTLKGLTNVKDVPKSSISGLEKVDLKLDLMPEMIKVLVKNIQETNNDAEKKLSWLKILCCVINLLSVGPLKQAGPYIRAEEGQENLLEQLIEIVHANERVLKEENAPFYGGYATFYDYYVWELLVLGEKLCSIYGKDTAEWKQINKIVIDKLMQKINPEDLKGFVQEKYYARIQDVDFTAFKVEHFTRLVRAKDRLNLVRNLNHTQKLLLNDSAKHVKNAEVCACLLQAFKEYQGKIQEDIKDPEELEVLKNIGIFMLGLLNMKIPGLEEIKEDFVLVLLGFLGQKCLLNKWDIFNMQRSLGLVLYKLKSTSKIYKEKPLYQLIGVTEGEIGASARLTKVLLNAETLMKDKKIKEKMFEIVIPSLEGIEKGLIELWGNSPQTWEMNNDMKTKETISRIREYCRRYIFFTLPWMSCFLKGLRPRVDVKDGERLLNVMNKVISLGFHPVFTLFLFPSERRILLESLAAIIQCNSWTRWTANLVYCRVLKDQIRALDSLESPMKQEFIKETRYEGFCLPVYQDNKVYAQSIDRSMAGFHSLLVGVSELPVLFHWIENCPLGVKQQEEVVEGIKGLLEAVWGFVPEFNRVFRGQGVSGEYTKKFEGHFERIKQGITAIIKNFNKMEKSHEILYKSFYEILMKVLLKSAASEAERSLLNFLGYVLNHTGGEIQRKAIMYFASNIGVWEPLMKKIMEGVNLKNMEKIKGLNEVFSVKNIESGKVQDMVRLQEIKGTSKEYVKKLFERVDEELSRVPFWEIVFLKDSGLKEIFYSILKIYEEYFMYLLKYYQAFVAGGMVIMKGELHAEGFEVGQEREFEKKLRGELEEIQGKFYPKVELGIQIYPFSVVKELESEAERVGKCQQRAKQRVVRMVYEFNLGLVKAYRPKIFEEFGVQKEEGKFLEREGLEGLIEKACNYFSYLREVLTHEDKKEIEFDMPLDTLFWSLYESCVILLQEALLGSSQKETRENLKGMIQEALELLLPYFMNNFFQKRLLVKQSEAINKIVQLIYEAHRVKTDVICPNGLIFRDMMKMLLVAFYSDRKIEAQVLLGENSSLLKSLLGIKSESSWNMSAVEIVLLVFNAFVEDSLPGELAVEMRIKQLLAAGPCKLVDLARDSSVQDLERTSQNSLIKLLKDKFMVRSNVEDVNDKNRWVADNLVVLIDEGKEKKDPQRKIQEILNKQSGQAQKAFKMLVELFIRSHLDNLTNETNSSVKQDASGILNVICALFSRHKSLLITGAFQRENYSELVLSYRDKLESIKEMNLQDLQQMTFLECLFKLDYQSTHIEDIFNLINVFGSYTGITFFCPEDPKILLDASIILLNKFLELVRIDLEKKFKLERQEEITSTKGFLALVSAIRVLGYLSSQTCKAYNSELSKRYLRGGALKLLKTVLCVLGKSRRLYEEVIKIEGMNFSEILVKQLTGYYEERLGGSGLTREKVEELKQDHYERFLDETELKKQIEKHGELTKTAERNVAEGAQRREFENYGEDNIERGMEIFRGGESVNTLKVPVGKESAVSVDEDWEEAMGHCIKDLKNLGMVYEKNENKERAREAQKKAEELEKKVKEFFVEEADNMFECHNLPCVGAFNVGEVEKKIEEIPEESRFYTKKKKKKKKKKNKKILLK